MKVFCIEDPNQDYQDWIYRSTGLEISRIPLQVGVEYNSVGREIEGRCWGLTQAYYYISTLSEFGKIPTKYFRHTCEVRKKKLDDIIDDKDPV